jgi:hypothetical protein
MSQEWRKRHDPPVIVLSFLRRSGVVKKNTETRGEDAGLPRGVESGSGGSAGANDITTESSNIDKGR